MARRTKEEAQETRNLILDTAERLFSARGVAHTSLSDIAGAANLTRGAIYWHFKNKCDLFTAMVDRELMPFDELMAASIDAREPNPLQRMRDALVECLSDIARNPRRRTVIEILVLKWEHTTDMQPVIERKRDNARRAIDSMRRALANAVSKELLPANLDTPRAATLLHALIIGVVTDYISAFGIRDLLGEAPQLIDGYIDLLRYSPAFLMVPASLASL